jgi:hypothetical protein
MQNNLRDEATTNRIFHIRELRDFARVGSLEVPEIPGWRLEWVVITPEQSQALHHGSWTLKSMSNTFHAGE